MPHSVSFDSSQSAVSNVVYPRACILGAVPELAILGWQTRRSGVLEEVMNGFDARQYPA